MLAGQFLKRWDMDRAVGYAVAMRVWQLPAGLATTILIARYFTPDVQGYYYTFSTLLGLQSLVDLGLQWVLLHFASHEWARLRIDEQGAVAGDPRALDRLAAISRLARGWFVGTSLLYIAVVGTVGLWLFARESPGVRWQWPWLIALLMAAGSLLLSPLLAILEGCNQMLSVNRTRFWQVFTASLCVWSAIALGAQLWAVVLAFSLQVLWEAWLVLRTYGPFWRSLAGRQTALVDWRAEVWPLQWRIGIQSVLRYLAYQLFTPLMFYFHGAQVAGRMGMTWTILSSLQLAAFAPVRTSAARWGMLIAQREYRRLDQQFARTAVLTIAALTCALAGFGIFLWALQASGGRPGQWAERFLPLRAVVPLGCGLLALHVVQCLGVYIRAHKRDPLFRWLVLSMLVTIPLITWYGAPRGPTALATAFALVAGGLTLPGVAWIWWRTRRRWHAPAPASMEESGSR